MRRFGSLAEFAQQAGTRLGSSGWHPIGQPRIDEFARATGDEQWLHTDPRRAADGPFGQTVAHGYLLLSLIPVLCAEIYTVDGLGLVVNTGVEELTFLAPVRAGASVRLTADLLRTEPRARGALAAQVGVALQVQEPDAVAYRGRVGLLLRPQRLALPRRVGGA